MNNRGRVGGCLLVLVVLLILVRQCGGNVVLINYGNGNGTTSNTTMGGLDLPFAATATPPSSLTKSDIAVASKIEVRNVPALIEVIVETRNDVAVEVVGREDVVSTLTIKMENEALVVHGGSWICRRPGWEAKLILNTLNPVVFENCDYSQTKITFRVPVEIGVRIVGMHGNATVGDTLGVLEVDSSGGSRVHAGHVTYAFVSGSGGSHTIIESVDGEIDIVLSGGSTATINSGRGLVLEVDSSGGSVTIVNAGVAGNASIYTSGGSQVHIGGSIDGNVTFNGSGGSSLGLSCVRGDVRDDTSGGSNYSRGTCD